MRCDIPRFSQCKRRRNAAPCSRIHVPACPAHTSTARLFLRPMVAIAAAASGVEVRKHVGGRPRCRDCPSKVQGSSRCACGMVMKRCRAVQQC
eukprot:1185342-Prymnesium_polylepis.1